MKERVNIFNLEGIYSINISRKDKNIFNLEWFQTIKVEKNVKS